MPFLLSRPRYHPALPGLVSAPSWAVAYHRKEKGVIQAKCSHQGPRGFPSLPLAHAPQTPSTLPRWDIPIFFPERHLPMLSLVFPSQTTNTSQPGNPCWPAWEQCRRRICHSATRQVQKAVCCFLDVLSCAPSLATASPWSEDNLISLPKEVEMSLQVTLSSWSILLGGLCHTSHANHTHPGA